MGRGDPGTRIVRRAGESPASSPRTTEDPARVVNPVYQEAHLHGPEDGSSLCLLMTGRSFDHHFSAAVTLVARPVSRRRGSSSTSTSPIVAALRSRVLAATYLVGLDSGALVDAAPDRIIWQVPDPVPGRLELLAIRRPRSPWPKRDGSPRGSRSSRRSSRGRSPIAFATAGAGPAPRD